MSENVVTIPDEYGIKDTYKPYCSFDYEGNHYIIAEDTNDSEMICGQICWSLFKGMILMREPVSSEIFQAANSLLNKSYDNPTKYSMKGEHYRIIPIKNNGRFGLRFIKQSSASKYFSPVLKYFSTIVCLLFALLFAVLYSHVYLNSTGIMWVAMLFPGLTRQALKIILFLFEMIGASILFFVRDEYRDVWDLIINAIIPLNIISFVGVAKAKVEVLIVTISVLIIFSLIRVVPFVRRKNSKDNKNGKNIEVKCVLNKMVSPIFSCIICFMFVIKLFGVDGYTNMASTKTSYPETDTIIAHYDDALKKINENVWYDLNAQEQIDVLQSICDYECAYSFGCETATVQAGYTNSDELLGKYNHITNTIFINVEHMIDYSVTDVIDTLLHEVRHVYQYSVVNMLNRVEGQLKEEDLRLPIFQYALSMRDCFDKYENGDLNYDDYYEQAAEEDSRFWAENEYYNFYRRYIYLDSMFEIEPEYGKELCDKKIGASIVSVCNE